MLNDKPQRVAVIGAGIAGASCANALMLAGHSVHVFDKSRGPGGRMATRRLEWIDRHGEARATAIDHGAVGISASSVAFRGFVAQASRAGALVDWTPKMSAGSLPVECGDRLYVPVPGMPALCRFLLDGAQTTWSLAIDRLRKDPLGWQVESDGERHPEQFDTVLLALPPAQAAPLLGPHRIDWARHASVVPMQPCWTLMGIADHPQAAALPALNWDLARPPTGPLSCVLRSDGRPGRTRVNAEVHWVAHARPGFSRRHLEQPASWVQRQMQAALADWLGRAIEWQHCSVHRWRYALPPQQARSPAPSGACWWDAAQRLGACGDFLGNAGVEGAWLSGQALSRAVLRALDGPGALTSALPCEDSLPRLVA